MQMSLADKNVTQYVSIDRGKMGRSFQRSLGDIDQDNRHDDRGIFKTVADWRATVRHPRFNRPYTDLVYQAMLELLTYLRANGFKPSSCPAAASNSCASSRQVYGIPPEQVVGSSGVTKLQLGADGKAVLIKEAKIEFVDDGPDKPVSINRFTAGDRSSPPATPTATCRCCNGRTGGGTRLMGIVHHTDAEREYAYGRQSHDNNATT